MEREIKFVAVLPAAKLLAAVYGVAFVVISPVMVVFLAVTGDGLLVAIGKTLLLLVAYPAIGFVQGALLAAIYNVMARRFGGLRVTVD